VYRRHGYTKWQAASVSVIRNGRTVKPYYYFTEGSQVVSPEDKDICVKCYLSATHWIGLKALAESRGLSQSAFLRQMVVTAIEHHARRQFAEEQRSSERTDFDPE
jgi:hypothetical protein